MAAQELVLPMILLIMSDLCSFIAICIISKKHICIYVYSIFHRCILFLRPKSMKHLKLFLKKHMH